MMVRKGMMFGASLAAIALLAGSALAQRPTPTPMAWPFPAKGATFYKTTFARGMDACAPAPGPWPPGQIPVHDESGAFIGCVAWPDQTDAMQFGKAQLVLNKARGKYVLSGSGFPVGTEVDLVFTVQVTRKLVTTVELGHKTVTYPVQTGTCPTATVNTKGALLLKAYLDDCLSYKLVDPTPSSMPVPGGSENSKFEMVNIEVQGAILTDHMTGKTIGTAGIVR